MNIIFIAHINSKSAQFVASCTQMLDDFSRIIINMDSLRSLSSLKHFADFSRLTAAWRPQVQSRSEAAWCGASPGSPINRASSDPQKRDDVVKGEGRSRRGAKAALGSSWALSSSIAGGTLLREMLLHYRNLQISPGPR